MACRPLKVGFWLGQGRRCWSAVQAAKWWCRIGLLFEVLTRTNT